MTTSMMYRLCSFLVLFSLSTLMPFEQLRRLPDNQAPSDQRHSNDGDGDETMQIGGSNRTADLASLGARILISLLFLIFGYDKLRDYGGAVAYMGQVGAPSPSAAAVIAIVAELGLSIALILGAFTRLAAPVLAIYTLATALIGHRFWMMIGADRYLNEINFFKNISIIGGLVLLSVQGAGRYSIDAWLQRRR
jgi:putative oxidoreductase